MRDDPLRATLRDDVFPAMLAEVNASRRSAVLRTLLWLIASRMAAARGTLLPLLVRDDVPTRVIDAGQVYLSALDFSRADIHLLGILYTDLLDDRRRYGCYYTPPDLARRVADWTIEPLLAAIPSPSVEVDMPPSALVSRAEPAFTILDPAMGSGSFLIAAGEVIAQWLRGHNPETSESEVRWTATRCLVGIDRDPLAVELAAISLWLWAAHPGTSLDDLRDQLRYGDALLDDSILAFERGRVHNAPAFDVVIGNPPFASVFTRAQSGPDQGAAIQARYETATGSFDLAVPFVERAIRLCRPGGFVGLVLPNKLLSADYARRLREWLGERATVRTIADYSQRLPFEAGVYPVVIVMQRKRPQPSEWLTIYCVNKRPDAPHILRRGTQRDLHIAPGRVWSAALDPDWDNLRGCCESAMSLGQMATLAEGLTVAEAYELRDLVVEAPLGVLPPEAVRLITSGLIARHHTQWGAKETRFLKRRFRRPIVMIHALPPRRRTQALADKIIVAGLGTRPQAFVDRGLAQASVSTTVIMESAWPLGALCALINSKAVARLTRALFGGLALGGGYLRLGKRELSLLPIPNVPANDPRLARLDVLARQMAHVNPLDRSGIDEEIDAVVWELYGMEARGAAAPGRAAVDADD